MLYSNSISLKNISKLKLIFLNASYNFLLHYIKASLCTFCIQFVMKQSVKITKSCLQSIASFYTMKTHTYQRLKSDLQASYHLHLLKSILSSAPLINSSSNENLISIHCAQISLYKRHALMVQNMLYLNTHCTFLQNSSLVHI